MAKKIESNYLPGFVPESTSESTDTPIGRKYDSGKSLMSLVPPNALKEVADVLTIGASKYDPGNWMIVDELMYRYSNAAERHLMAWRLGEQLDPETGKNHLAHAICCLMFMLEKESVPEERWGEYVKRELKFCGHPSIK